MCKNLVMIPVANGVMMVPSAPDGHSTASLEADSSILRLCSARNDVRSLLERVGPAVASVIGSVGSSNENMVNTGEKMSSAT